MSLQSAFLFALTMLATLSLTPPAFAQFAGTNIKGDFGLNSGSQPPAGIYVSIPFSQWSVDSIKNADGEPFLPQLFQGFDLRLVLPTVVGVTPVKVLGANYGFMVAVPFSTFRPERTTEETPDPSWGFSDLYVMPVSLGWHLPRADFVSGYGFVAPTGKYEAGATDNVGLGMWSHEIQGGTTVFLDAAKTVSVATTAFLEFHSNKKDQDLKVGNLLTLEGGAAYNLPSIGGAFGVAYYLQKKVSDDTGADVPDALLRLLNLRGRNRIFGVGPEVTMGVFRRGATGGIVTIRYFWESAARSSFQGSNFLASFTLARFAQ